MAENLMNSAHKASTKAYRDSWDRIFGGVPESGQKERSAKPCVVGSNPIAASNTKEEEESNGYENGNDGTA